MNILITAGPTWTKIDDVRILTSIFTGKTGLYLAERFSKKGDSVSLVINDHCIDRIPEKIKIVKFRYFEELKKALIKQLLITKYDAIIHSSAVSDYTLKNAFSGKIPSGKKNLILKLTPTEKLIKLIKKLAKDSIIVQFKLEIKRRGLIEKAYKSLKENKVDFVVANALEDLRTYYKAFFIDKDKNIVEVSSKKELFNVIYKAICNCKKLG